MISTDPLRGPWLLCAALVMLAVVARRGARPRAGELWLVGAIGACAIAARLVWGVWGPLHVNGQGPLWIRGALEPGALASYGPGYFELFNWVTRLGAAPDRAVFATNALLSGMSSVLLYATARIAGVERGGALAAALVTAADPVTIRTAATEGYFSSLIVLALAAQASLVLGLQARVRRDWLGAGLAMAAAGLLAAAAARIHPVGYLPLALCPLVVLGCAVPEAWRARASFAALAAAVVGATVLLTSARTLVSSLEASPVTARALASVGVWHGVLLVAMLATVWQLRRRIRQPWMTVLAVLSLVLLLGTRGGFRQHPTWELCYERLFWPGVLLGAASLLPRWLRAPGRAVATAAVTAGAVLVAALAHLAPPTTEQLEYRFLQRVLEDAPAGCTLAAVNGASIRVWEIPSYLVPARGSEQSGSRPVQRASDLHIVAGCVLYVRASLCTTAEARALCESVEREVALERVASTVVAAEPSYAFMPYDRPEVEVVVFRVITEAAVAERARANAVADGAAITPAFAQTLYDQLMALREPDGCRVARLDTSRFRMVVGLRAASGQARTLEISTADDGSGTPSTANGWALAVPDGLERECAATLAAIERVLPGARSSAP